MIMKLKEKIIRETENLKPNQLSMIYGIILSMKREQKKTEITSDSINYGAKSRKALKSIKGSLSDEIIKLRTEKETIKFDTINTLINFKYDLIKNIPVKLKRTNGEVIGEIEELEIYAFGRDEFEVLREINEDVTDLFEELIETEDKKLGKFPKKWKNILQKYIRI